MGLRELKKEQTRQLIADTGWQLFVDRGFDQVSVAEVAQEAQVAQATVYNYFRTKEDLALYFLEQELEDVIHWYENDTRIPKAALPEQLFAIIQRSLDRHLHHHRAVPAGHRLCLPRL